MKKYIGCILVMMCLFNFMGSVAAQQNDSARQETEAAWHEAQKVQVVGPAEISLQDQGKVKLPSHYIFIPSPQANRLMKSMGNGDCPEMVGMIMSDDDNEDWMITIDYTKSGYIKDDEAKNWQVDELFDSLKKGTKENNKDRIAKGLPELAVTGWVEKPQYDSVNHYLVWSIELTAKGEKEKTINYNTYALGREGYLTLTLVTDLKNIGTQKAIAQNVLAATTFVPGKRYEEFNAVTDNIAEYGLAALVTGVAAKKLGFVALALAFVAKFAKLVVIGVGAVGLLIVKLFKGKKSGNDKTESPEK